VAGTTLELSQLSFSLKEYMKYHNLTKFESGTTLEISLLGLSLNNTWNILTELYFREEPGQSERTCMLVWLHTGGKGWSL
jgi:hypothetical protein